MTAIGESAFSGCTKLESVTLPTGLQSVGNYAFDGCKALTGALTLPAGVTSVGKYAFRVVDVGAFMMEFFGSRKTVLTYDIIQYLASMVSAAFAQTVAESRLSVLDMSSQVGTLTAEVLKKVNQSGMMLGITFTDVLIEGLSLPDGVEKHLDQQTGIHLRGREENPAAPIRTDPVKPEAAPDDGGPKTRKLRTLKTLLDEGILTQEEFEAEKKKVLDS